MNTIYIIKKVFVTEGEIEQEVEAYSTEEDRDQAWEDLIKQHNAMMEECHGWDFDADEDEPIPDFEYSWDSQSLSCYNAFDPTEEGYYFHKDKIELQ